MTLEQFLALHAIPQRAPMAAAHPEAVVGLDCAVLAQDEDRLVVERHGTVYEVLKADVSAVDMPDGPVVTRTQRGHPARLTLRAGAQVMNVRRRGAAELEAVLPYVLAQPTAARGFESLEPDHHADWLAARGIAPTDGPIVKQTDTNSPSPSARSAATASADAGSGWSNDDAAFAGYATDETWQDDITNDADWVGSDGSYLN